MVHLFFPDIQQTSIFNIIRTLRDVRCDGIKIWLSSFQKQQHKALLVAANLKPIEQGISYNHNEFCFEWDYLKNCNQALHLPDEYYYWLHRKNQGYQNDFFAIVTDKKPTKLDTKTIFIDGNDKTKLPSDWYCFECLYDWKMVFDYCLKRGVIDSILLNPERFEVVEGKKYKGAQIYKEKSTGYYWYKDTFHTNGSEHLEVFDSTGKKHLGEADVTNGVLDVSKADPDKKPIL